MGYDRSAQQELFVSAPIRRFGGKWTSEKLHLLAKYLNAYTLVFKNQPYFHTVYVDAFAGSGYVNFEKEAFDSSAQLPLPIEFEKDESAGRLIEGSARVALQTEHSFSEYIFIEKQRSKVRDLQKLKNEFVDRANLIKVEHAEANQFLSAFCKGRNWQRQRAVVFLDPYGMQVNWDTVKLIAATKAIDLWYLFPTGLGINRLLTKSGEIDPQWEKKLTNIFGTKEWKDYFYPKVEVSDLFGSSESRNREVDFDRIEEFFIERLETVFEHVAQNPYRMLNSRGSPMYSFCFAAGNPRGGKIALRIAKYLLR